MPKRPPAYRAPRPTRDRPSAAARGYGHRWRRLSAATLRDNPVCAHCGREPSAQVDHKVSKVRGGTDDPSNLEALCASCHSVKTCSQDGGLGLTPKERR